MSTRNLVVVIVLGVASLLFLAHSRAAGPSPATASAGPAWYRCYIRMPKVYVTPAEKDLFRDSVTLNLGDVRGAFAVYVNGQKIAEGDSVPAGPRRRFKVPKGILQKDVFNVLAIRLDGSAAGYGLGEAPILAGYHDELVLDKEWDITRGQELEAKEMTPLAKQPAGAFYIEAGFKPASSPLGRNAELMPGVRVPPERALSMMKTADDLVVELIASEPVVAQPTHISFDERGRMWVAQYRQYPYPAGLKMVSRDMYYRSRFDKVPPPPPHQDKGADIITVHEDVRGDGSFAKSKVVLDGLNMANSVLRGHGGIWVMNTPYLMFYPDADGDDVPDRDPEVRLAGFGLEDTHSVANGLTWGPDGWLYGGQGSTTTSRVTRPGVDPANFPGVYFEGCMVWRYHPEKKIYEIFAEGGGNTFGLDFDSEGRLYSGHNGGVTHGFHFVQGGLYLKQGVSVDKYGPPANPYAYGTLPQLKSRNPIPRFTHNIIMYEGTALPSEYVGRMFGADPLHHYLAVSERYAVGSTFETSDSGFPLRSDDVTFRPVYLTNAPDGAIYVADFCEEFIAHGQNYQGQIDPGSGRIYRLRGKDMPLNKDTNLAAKTRAQLVATMSHPNRWHRQTAARLLAERHDLTAVEPLKALLKEGGVHPALEAVWALDQLGALDETTAEALLAHPAGPVRAWVVRLMGDAKVLPEGFFAALMKRIAVETDPEVRCQIAATARRLPAAQGLAIVAAMMQHDADAEDPYVPLMDWWAIESHCDGERDAVLGMLKEPAAWDGAVMKQFILPRLMRRLASKGTHADFVACTKLLNDAPSAEHRKVLLAGFEEAFKGRALPALPEELAAALAKSGEASPLLRVRLGDPEAIRAALKVAVDPKAKMEERIGAVKMFGEVKAAEAPAALLAVAKEKAAKPELRKAALAALVAYEDESIGSEVAAAYGELPAEVRTAAMTLLASRTGWSVDFLRLVERGTVETGDVPPGIVARLRAQEDPRVVPLVTKLFPKPRPAPQTARLDEVRRVRSAIESGTGDPYKGEATFLGRCAACHTLFHKGGNIGPNLTSYQRDDLGTMLISIVDPSAEIREGFQNYLLTTKDGRTLSGFLTDNDNEVVAIRELDGQDVRVRKADVAELKALPTSIMPDGLLEGLGDQELRDFFAYLRMPQPISK
jgi:putative membrane-bound dehydrogenase-like protein